MGYKASNLTHQFLLTGFVSMLGHQDADATLTSPMLLGVCDGVSQLEELDERPLQTCIYLLIFFVSCKSRSFKWIRRCCQMSCSELARTLCNGNGFVLEHGRFGSFWSACFLCLFFLLFL